ncbi:GlxA family transcriptional regulator [Kiloniella laminariae]|uniref:GlxA family transcriptional regulator n=1 Tax=Kiloniella laminariae TaxID=454162 RepID=UPI00037C9E90|nr:helix-turn-helix domain-containing protein [Kiloniella laminariae]
MSKEVHLAVLAYPGVMQSALHGLTELFDVTNSLVTAHPDSDWPIFRCRIQNVEPALSEVKSGQEKTIDQASEEIAAYDVVILPPRTTKTDWNPGDGNCRNWLQEQHGKGAILASACAGAFLLADAGLLRGRRVTTHWGLAEEFRELYPEINLCEQELLLDEGDIITAGGMMAWMDLALRLVERFASPFLSLELGKYFLVDTGQRDQRCYQNFSPKFSHGDQEVLNLQRWLQANWNEGVDIGEMARIAQMGERTLQRRFTKATGLSPSIYVMELRLQKAREYLEVSRMTVDEIVWKVGYEDQSSFRKLFKRETGLTPSEYRKRFSR